MSTRREVFFVPFPSYARSTVLLSSFAASSLSSLFYRIKNSLFLFPLPPPSRSFPLSLTRRSSSLYNFARVSEFRILFQATSPVNFRVLFLSIHLLLHLVLVPFFSSFYRLLFLLTMPTGRTKGHGEFAPRRHFISFLLTIASPPLHSGTILFLPRAPRERRKANTLIAPFLCVFVCPAFVPPLER